MRFLPLALFTIVVATSGIVRAATIPLQLDITDGVNAQHLVIDAPLEILPGTLHSFDITGSVSSTSWSLDWRLTGIDVFVSNDLGLLSEARVTPSYTLKNLSGDQRDYLIRATMPVQPAASATYWGYVGGGVTDVDGNGAFLSGDASLSPYLYMSLVDGAMFQGALDSSRSVQSGAFQTKIFQSIDSAYFAFPHPYPSETHVAGPAVNSEIGIQLAFSLSGGDFAHFNSLLDVRRVPEPSAFWIAVTAILLLVCVRVSLRQPLGGAT